MIGFFLQHKNAFREHARYTFRQLGKMIGVRMVEIDDPTNGLDYLDLLFIYGDSLPKTPKHIPIIFLAQTDYAQRAALTPHDVSHLKPVDSMWPESILYLFKKDIALRSRPLYVDEKSTDTLISRDDKSVVSAVDIISTCFYFLSLENERRATDRDRFHRFQKDFSPLGDTIYDMPVVDRYATLLRGLIQQLVPQIEFQPLWPNDTNFAVALTHDVDRIPTWTITKAKRALRSAHSPYKNPVGRLFRVIQSISYPENWLGNFNFISRLEQRFGAASTFFFVSRHRHELDPNYKLNSPIISQGINLVKNRGGQVGIHGTIPSSMDNGFLELEKEDLEFFINDDVVGGRQHYLCFTDDTPTYWQNAKLKYDSTLGFSYHTGYRCGTSFPFNLHDGKQESPIIELPLILMDTVLFLESKQFLSAAHAWPVIEAHLEETKRNSALLTINWHNSDLHPYDVYGYSDLYVKILQWAQEHNGWLASTDQVYDWWDSK